MKELRNVKLYPSIHKMKNNRENYRNILFCTTPFTIQEKIDGSNISIIKLNKELHIFSRNQNITNSLANISGITPFIEKNRESFYKFLKNGEVLNGEWLASGKIKYVSNLNELKFDERFVLFNLGKLTKLTIKELNSNNRPLTEKDNVQLKELSDRRGRKISFYSNKYTSKRIRRNIFISSLKSTIDNSIEERFRLEKFNEKFWEIYDYSSNLNLGNTMDGSFEEWLISHPTFMKSKIYPTSTEIEGIIFKTEDSSIMLKYVLNTFSKKMSKRPQKSSKVFEKIELDFDQKLWLRDILFHSENRFHKFLQYVSEQSEVFRALHPDEILLKISNDQNGGLIGVLFSHINWLINDIKSEEVYDKVGNSFSLDDKSIVRSVKQYLIELIRNEIY